jgi:hypothetical protein
MTPDETPAGHYSLDRERDQHQGVDEDAVTALTTGVECATQTVGFVGTEVTGLVTGVGL